MASIETEVEAVKCYCCGLTEECTVSYINRVKESYGRWICGLCAEAVKEERDISTDEALNRHMNFRTSISSPPNKPTHDLIIAVKHLLFRSLVSPRKQQSLSFQTRSCFNTVNGTTQGESQQSHTRIVQGGEIGL